MPRRNGPAFRRTGRSSRGAARPPSPQPVGGHEHVESAADGDWVVRRVTGTTAAKVYRCPGCLQLVPATTPHVVAWPVVGSTLSGGGVAERRHWHSSCWRARGRRRPL